MSRSCDAHVLVMRGNMDISAHVMMMMMIEKDSNTPGSCCHSALVYHSTAVCSGWDSPSLGYVWLQSPTGRQ